MGRSLPGEFLKVGRTIGYNMEDQQPTEGQEVTMAEAASNAFKEDSDCGGNAG